MSPNIQIIHGKSFDEEAGKSTGVEIIQTERTTPPEVSIDPHIERQLVRKLDLRLMIWAFLAYFANLLDRNNMRKYILDSICYIDTYSSVCLMQKMHSPMAWRRTWT